MLFTEKANRLFQLVRGLFSHGAPITGINLRVHLTVNIRKN